MRFLTRLSGVFVAGVLMTEAFLNGMAPGNRKAKARPNPELKVKG
jgi:hypothetical protein